MKKVEETVVSKLSGSKDSLGSNGEVGEKLDKRCVGKVTPKIVTCTLTRIARNFRVVLAVDLGGDRHRRHRKRNGRRSGHLHGSRKDGS